MAIVPGRGLFEDLNRSSSLGTSTKANASADTNASTPTPVRTPTSVANETAIPTPTSSTASPGTTSPPTTAPPDITPTSPVSTAPPATSPPTLQPTSIPPTSFPASTAPAPSQPEPANTTAPPSSSVEPNLQTGMPQTTELPLSPPTSAWTIPFSPASTPLPTLPNQTRIPQATALAPSSARTSRPPVPTLAVGVSPAETSSGVNSSIVAIGVGCGLFLVAVVAAVCVVFRAKRRRSLVKRDSEIIVTHDHVELMSPRSPRASTLSTLARLEQAATRIPFKRIRIGTVISRGGYGEVLRGTYNGQAIAIKRLLMSRCEDERRIGNLVNEITVTAALDHPCIVTFIGFAWDIPSNLCMVSELMAGGDLRSLLVDYRRRGLPTGFSDVKIQITSQVADSLVYIHGLDPIVVHRDLKSRNVLLTKGLKAKLTDFGVSTARRDYTLTAGVGTSLWMAPEVILGDRYNEKADIYSFGVLLSELDTHELPYAETLAQARGRNMNELVMMQLICQGRLTPRFTENADGEVVKVARDCLQLDPHQRPSAVEVLDRIHQIWQGREPPTL